MIKRQRWIRAGVTAAAALAAGYFAYEFLDDIPRPFRKWAALALGLIALAPIVGWQVVLPPAIDITAHAERVDYEFKDEDYALEFALLNGVRAQK